MEKDLIVEVQSKHLAVDSSRGFSNIDPFAVPPKMIPGPTVIETVENETVTLECPAQGGDAQLQWSRNGVVLTGSSHVQVGQV